MDDWKYIIVMNRSIETPILFPPWFGHDEVANGREVISAGFISIHVDDGKIKSGCYGKSISLRIPSRPEDTQIVQNMINNSWND
jgi:hypothetical protein